MSTTKAAVELAVRAAMAASLGAKGTKVSIEHPIFEGCLLACGLSYGRGQTYPSKIVRAWNKAGRLIWSTKGSYISGICGDVAKRGTPGSLVGSQS